MSEISWEGAGVNRIAAWILSYPVFGVDTYKDRLLNFRGMHFLSEVCIRLFALQIRDVGRCIKGNAGWGEMLLG